MWVVVAGIILFIIFFKPSVTASVSSGAVNVSPSPAPLPAPSPAPSPSSSIAATDDKGGSFLNDLFTNPALTMMTKEVGTLAATGGVSTGLNPSGSLLLMFQGDTHIGGQIGEAVGSTVASVAGLGGSMAFGIGFAAMALGEIIGGFFEDDSPLSKAQQGQIAALINSGIDRMDKVRAAGYTDQQVMAFVEQTQGFWFLVDAMPIVPGDIKDAATGLFPHGTRLGVACLYDQQEKDALDRWAASNYAIQTDISYLAGTAIGTVVLTWAEVEGYPGGWLNHTVDLGVMTQDYIKTQSYHGGSWDVLGGAPVVDYSAPSGLPIDPGFLLVA